MTTKKTATKKTATRKPVRRTVKPSFPTRIDVGSRVVVSIPHSRRTSVGTVIKNTTLTDKAHTVVFDNGDKETFRSEHVKPISERSTIQKKLRNLLAP